MIGKKYILAVLVAGSLLIGSAAAQDGLALMKVEAGARPSGMGAAFTSIDDDPNASFYNPAAVGQRDGFGASFSHNAYWENVRIETGYVAWRLSSRTRFHGGIRYAAIDDLESRTGPTNEPDAYFDSHDVSFKSGLAFDVTPRLTIGAAAGWFIEKIDRYRGSSFNLDLGVLYRATSRLALGASATNLGSDFKLSLSGQPGTTGISLPTTYRVGGVYKYDRILGAADLVILDDEAHVHLGAEGWLHEMAAVRAGYMIGYDTKNITAGASFVHRNFTIDYAFVPYTENLGTSHLFSLTLTI